LNTLANPAFRQKDGKAMDRLAIRDLLTLTLGRPGLYFHCEVVRSGSKHDGLEDRRRKAMQVRVSVPNATSLLPRQTTYPSSTRSLR
jgi:hypothetical protein